jgi:hypothetical protein
MIQPNLTRVKVLYQPWFDTNKIFGIRHRRATNDCKKMEQYAL